MFTGDPKRQVTVGTFQHTNGKLDAVTDLASALAALEEIVEQGEGAGGIWDGDRDFFHPDRDEVAHYYRFEELELGRRYQRGDTPASGPTGEPITLDPAGIAPMPPNPQPSADPAVRAAQLEFDNTYCMVLYLLEQAFNGEPTMIRDSIRAMYGLKAGMLKLLNLGSGPTFTYIEPDDRT